jgi:hypothetical protein
VEDHLQTIRITEQIPTVDPAFFVQPSILFCQDVDILRLTSQLNALEPLRLWSINVLTNCKSEALADNETHRGSRLREILTKTKSDERNFHPLDEADQNLFCNFLLDQRFKEGKKVQRLRELINDPQFKWTAEDVLYFITDVVREIIIDYKIPEEEAIKIRLFVNRTVFPLVFTHCYNYGPVETQSADDLIFCENVKWLGLAPPAKFGIPPQHCQELKGSTNSSDTLYAGASDKLNDLLFLVVPTDILSAIHEAMASITSEATARSGATSVGADEILPLFEYALIHSNLTAVHQAIAFVDVFSIQEEKCAEFGWCLTTLQAATAHICSMREDSLGLDEKSDG